MPSSIGCLIRAAPIQSDRLGGKKEANLNADSTKYRLSKTVNCWTHLNAIRFHSTNHFHHLFCSRLFLFLYLPCHGANSKPRKDCFHVDGEVANLANPLIEIIIIIIILIITTTAGARATTTIIVYLNVSESTRICLLIAHVLLVINLVCRHFGFQLSLFLFLFLFSFSFTNSRPSSH